MSEPVKKSIERQNKQIKPINDTQKFMGDLIVMKMRIVHHGGKCVKTVEVMTFFCNKCGSGNCGFDYVSFRQSNFVGIA